MENPNSAEKYFNVENYLEHTCYNLHVNSFISTVLL